MISNLYFFALKSSFFMSSLSVISHLQNLSHSSTNNILSFIMFWHYSCGTQVFTKMWLLHGTPFVFTFVSHGIWYATSKHSESTVSSCHQLNKRCTLQQLDAVTVETRIDFIFYYITIHCDLWRSVIKMPDTEVPKTPTAKNAKM